MIIHPGVPMGPRIGPPGRREGRRPPRRPKVAQTFHFPLFLRPAGHLSPLSEIFDKVQVPDCVFFLEHFNGWDLNLLQAAATATLRARDGPESSSRSSFMHNSPIT